jgi:adenine-specific DNA-methyltransferase
VSNAELLWDGKYAENGSLRKPLRVALPFQVVETINEATKDRQQTLLRHDFGTGWRDRLIWGDKKYVLPSLLEEFEGTIDLIYIDPPFDTGENFSYTAIVPAPPRADYPEQLEFVKAPSMIEQKAYRDTWGKDLNSYFGWLYDTLIVLRELLAETGSIFVHMDVHKGPYVKVLMDELFGSENFQNEIVWYYYNKLHDSRKRLLPKATDQILYYVKSRSSNYTYHALKEERDQPIKKLKYQKVQGRIQNIIGDDGKAVTYVSEDRTVDNVWRIRALQPANKKEWVNFDTQKPVDLIERIIDMSSNKDDLILDCFCGSGSSLVAAAKNSRRWIGADLGRFAIHTTRKRLLDLPGIKPFDILNLGKYERQVWQKAEFASGISRGDPGESDLLHEQYTAFIVNLYRAKRLNGYAWLHGLKAGRVVHVGSVDAPVTANDVTQIVAEMKAMVGTGDQTPTTNAIDVLGWDFAFDVNEVVQQQAAAARINLRFLRIPREVMDPKAVEQGDVYFFELGALGIDLKLTKRHAVARLTEFVIPPDDVPADIQKEVRHWSQWIDYWAIDWDNKDDAFHNQWQSFRTRMSETLDLSTTHEYEDAGKYRVVIKVVDILGNDTTKSIDVTVR